MKASVRITDCKIPPDQDWERSSDQDGRFQFNLPDGHYCVTARDGYAVASADVTVLSGRLTTVNMTMRFYSLRQ
jgi:hypothetical protein